MDKGKLIEAIKAEFPNYKNNFGLDFVIDLIEQWEEEPITAEALQAAGWSPSTGGASKNNGSNDWDNHVCLVVTFSPLKTFIGITKRGNDLRIYAKATTMPHLHALEEMFLS